jgi:hypothetical protein
MSNPVAGTPIHPFVILVLIALTVGVIVQKENK